VIRVDDSSGLQPAWFGNSDKARLPDDLVLAVGNLFGLSGSAGHRSCGWAGGNRSIGPGSTVAILSGVI
jgi:hypothetical protein